MQCVVCIVQCALTSVQCAMYSVHWKNSSKQCALSNVNNFFDNTGIILFKSSKERRPVKHRTQYDTVSANESVSGSHEEKNPCDQNKLFESYSIYPYFCIFNNVSTIYTTYCQICSSSLIVYFKIPKIWRNIAKYFWFFNFACKLHWLCYCKPRSFTHGWICLDLGTQGKKKQILMRVKLP